MQRAIYVAGAVAVFAAAIFVWSHTALIRPQASTASTIGGGANAAPTEASVTIFPLDMMKKYDKPLPSQAIDTPF